MAQRLFHEEIGGGYSMQRKIIVDACELYGEFEVMAMSENGSELESITVQTPEEAKAEFRGLVLKYAGPLQKAFYAAGLEPGGRYTLVYLNDSGFPVAQNITYRGMSCTTYAQYADVVELEFTPRGSRRTAQKPFYKSSLFIFKGWQSLRDEDIYCTLHKSNGLTVERSKYDCFSSDYMEDALKRFADPVLIYKNYRRSVNGKLYA